MRSFSARYQIAPICDDPDHEARVRDSLANNLFASPFGFLGGAACGLAMAGYVWLHTDDAVLSALSAALIVIIFVRVATVFFYHVRLASKHKADRIGVLGDDSSDDSENRSLAFVNRADSRAQAVVSLLRRREITYDIGLWIYSVTLGVFSALVVANIADIYVHVLVVANVSGYAAAVASRNAGRPNMAIALVLLTVLPLAGSLAATGVVAYHVLAFSQGVFLISLITITMQTYTSVYKSHAEARRKDRIADSMREFAATDPLTGLINRAGFKDIVKHIAQAETPTSFAVFWIDLDRFKDVNDTMGYSAGDRLLVVTAKRLQSLCDENHKLVRFGGDEFVIIAPALSKHQADAFGRLIMTVISQELTVGDRKIIISASLGVSLCYGEDIDVEEIMRQADVALCAAKAEGRNRQRFFLPAMDTTQIRRRTLERDIRDALRNNKLELHYQPIIDLHSGRIDSFEALARWHHPDYGMLRPEEFIDIAEASGVIITLGNWVVLQACRELSTWPHHIKVSVNLSPMQMQAPGAILGFKNALKMFNLAPHRLELEVTENSFVSRTEHTMDFIRSLHDSGIGLVLDDFGIGYSSLSYIRDFHFSKIKIDRSFTCDSIKGDRASDIIATVAELAKRLDVPVVAEGIESAQVEQQVRKLGCTHGQGFHYSAAMPADAVLELLAQEMTNISAQVA